MICVLGPKGGTGKTLTASNLASRSPQPGTARRRRRPRPPVRRRRARARARARADDLRPRHVGRLARRREARGLPGRRTSRARACCWRRRGPDQAGAVTIEFLRDVYALLRSSYDYVIVDTPPGLHARGDRVDRRSTARLHGRDARLAVAQEHEARARDARADGLRPASASRLVLNRADSQRRHHAATTSTRSSGRDARRARAERPRHRALGQRGRADRAAPAGARRRRRRSAQLAASTVRDARHGRRPPKRRARRLLGGGR